MSTYICFRPNASFPRGFKQNIVAESAEGAALLFAEGISGEIRVRLAEPCTPWTRLQVDVVRHPVDVRRKIVTVEPIRE